MDYKGYKLIDRIKLICRDYLHPTDEKEPIYQAYLVDPSNKSQMDSAMHWATWTEYGPSHLNNETNKWEREYEIIHEPLVFEFDNKDFKFQLLDCAGGSSQGGKLSFWNCIVEKDGTKFKIGINSEILLNVLKEGTFEKGICKETVSFVSKKGQCGVVIKDGVAYNEALADMLLKDNLGKGKTKNYKPGDIVSTTTMREVYVGSYPKYYEFLDFRDDYTRYRCNVNTYHYKLPEWFKVRKLTEPEIKNYFESACNYYTKEHIDYNGLKEIFDNNTLWPNNGKPARKITGQIPVDITEEEIKQHFIDKYHNLRDCEYKQLTELDKLLEVLRGTNFGVLQEELPEELVALCNKYNISII